jgi:Zn-dependent alcohol dehydrogenase
MTSTRALVTYDAEDGSTDPSFVMEELDVYEPEEDELLVRMVATGLCHTDITAALRPGDGTPRVLGHEGSIPCPIPVFQ